MGGGSLTLSLDAGAEGAAGLKHSNSFYSFSDASSGFRRFFLGGVGGEDGAEVSVVVWCGVDEGCVGNAI